MIKKLIYINILIILLIIPLIQSQEFKIGDYLDKTTHGNQALNMTCDTANGGTGCVQNVWAVAFNLTEFGGNIVRTFDSPNGNKFVTTTETPAVYWFLNKSFGTILKLDWNDLDTGHPCAFLVDDVFVSVRYIGDTTFTNVGTFNVNLYNQTRGCTQTFTDRIIYNQTISVTNLWDAIKLSFDVNTGVQDELSLGGLDINASDNINALPNITSFICTNQNATSITNTYQLNVSADDEENDTIMYAFSCNNRDSDGNFIYGINNFDSAELLLFKNESYSHREFVGGDNVISNLQICDFRTEYNEDYGVWGWKMNYTDCDNTSIRDQIPDAGYSLAFTTRNNDFQISTDGLEVISEIQNVENTHHIIIFSETYATNNTAILKINVTTSNRNGDTLNHTISYATDNVDLSGIGTNLYSGFITRPIIKTQFNYNNNSAIIRIYDQDNNFLTLKSVNLLEGRIRRGYIFQYPNNNNVFIKRLAVYDNSFPIYSTNNQTSCSYDTAGDVSAIVYVTDNVHPNNYDNYLTCNFTSTILSVEIDQEGGIKNTIDSLAGENLDTVHTGAILGIFLLFITTLVGIYKSTGSLTKSNVAGTLIFIMTISIPLAFFGILPTWTVILTALILGLFIFLAVSGGDGG